MAKEKKFVEEITSMEEDFSQWYTDVVRKADLMSYSSIKGCMIIRPYILCDLGAYTKGSGPAFQRDRARKMCICPCLFPKVCFKRRRIMLRICP